MYVEGWEKKISKSSCEDDLDIFWNYRMRYYEISDIWAPLRWEMKYLVGMAKSCGSRHVFCPPQG